jgi:hypothetical protein
LTFRERGWITENKNKQINYKSKRCGIEIDLEITVRSGTTILFGRNGFIFWYNRTSNDYSTIENWSIFRHSTESSTSGADWLGGTSIDRRCGIHRRGFFVLGRITIVNWRKNRVHQTLKKGRATLVTIWRWSRWAGRRWRSVADVQKRNVDWNGSRALFGH